ncbi:MAG: glycosyltransferase family 2 protein [Chitinophagaceae bacterium]|nr:glycosyltransferase family 2 protein [Chitinophagaceae bacterium]
MIPENTSRWVSFCISTFRRPVFLKEQITLLLTQQDPDFEIVISDNDPEGSGAEIAASFNDDRVRYFRNEENLGMIKSFNKSIERATTPFITMVTDDDPIQPEFLLTLKQVIKNHPGYSFYGGVLRSTSSPGSIEEIEAGDFMEELLDPERTTEMLWSSCILNREDALKAGTIPDFGSPHLADHALLALSGSQGGGVFMNQTFSSLNVHETNFSKSNFTTYIQGCKGFYETMSAFVAKRGNAERGSGILKKHLSYWFIPCMFNLKRFYTIKNDQEKLKQVDECGRTILSFPFMSHLKGKYERKEFILRIKKTLGLLKKS